MKLQLLMSMDPRWCGTSHAGCAPHEGHTGADPNYKIRVYPSPTITRWAIPRRLTTKIHALTDTDTCPLPYR